MTDIERALEQLRNDCAAIADGLAVSVSRGADRLQDFDRGQLAAASHIARKIRALKLAGYLPPRTGMTEGG